MKEYLTPVDNFIPINLEKTSSIVDIDYIEWYWDCINDYIINNHNAFGSMFGMSNFIQLPHCVSYLEDISYVYDKDLLCNELKYLCEFGEVLNAYIYGNIKDMGEYELQYIIDSVSYLELIKAKCLKAIKKG